MWLALVVSLPVPICATAQETPPAPPITPAPTEGDDPPQDPADPARSGGTDEEKSEAQKRREERAAKRRERREAKQPPAAPGQRWIDAPALGASPGQLRFLDVAASPDGRRQQFDPVKDDVAFEVWLEGIEPRTRLIEEPDPATPGATRVVGKETVVSVLEVTNAEWDDYFSYLKRLAPPGDDSMFMTVLLSELLEQKSMLLHYRDELPAVEKRAAAAVAKLKAGVAFKEVVRVHSEDETSRSADGLCLDSDRSGQLQLYPFPKALFELEQVGDIAGPYYNKQAAYILMVDHIGHSANMPWFDAYRAKGVVFRYPTGPNMKAQQVAIVKTATRVRTSQPRFARVLPPGRQLPSPAVFGPDDCAPLGAPDAALRKRHLDDDRDQQVGGQ